jgi:hypothetical protein
MLHPLADVKVFSEQDRPITHDRREHEIRIGADADDRVAVALVDLVPQEPPLLDRLEKSAKVGVHVAADDVDALEALAILIEQPRLAPNEKRDREFVRVRLMQRIREQPAIHARAAAKVDNHEKDVARMGHHGGMGASPVPILDRTGEAPMPHSSYPARRGASSSSGYTQASIALRR